MENLQRFCLLLILAPLTCIAQTAEQPTSELTGLELFDDTFGPADGRCGLGFLATGEPLTVTRTPSWYAGNVTVADNVTEVNGVAVENNADLKRVVRALEPGQPVELTLVRDDAPVKVRTRCRDATELLHAREEILSNATNAEWTDCIRATYVEEMRWGGSNSQTAGLRLWCQRSRARAVTGSSNGLTPLDARLLVDYVEQLHGELAHVPNRDEHLLNALERQPQRIAASGYPQLAAALSDKLIGQ